MQVPHAMSPGRIVDVVLRRRSPRARGMFLSKDVSTSQSDWAVDGELDYIMSSTRRPSKHATKTGAQPRGMRYRYVSSKVALFRYCMCTVVLPDS